MEFNKQVSNPMLIGAMELMKAEKTAEHNTMLLNEILKAQFLSPAYINPEPKVDAEGKVGFVPGTQIHFPMLTAPDGKHFFAAFTDQMEAEKWKQPEGIHYVALNFDDYAGMVLRKGPGNQENPSGGFVINPFGANAVISREMVSALVQIREQARRDAKK